jgi:hypothetical protein
MGRHHEEMTLEQKKETRDNAKATIEILAELGVQGNVSFPLYGGAVGKIHADLYLDPKLIPSIFKNKLK